MELQPQWEYVADTVMGGVSTGRVDIITLAGRQGTRLSGTVSLDNNGGFIQMAFDLNDGGVLDASDFEGVEIDVLGNGEVYDVRLRTDQLTRPWQSFRASFQARPSWQTVRLPFSMFEPSKTDVSLDLSRLRRVGILAIGRGFQSDVTVSGIRFYRASS